MSSLLLESVGWALLHSLWQGALVALLLAVALATVGRRAANARYALACGALVLSLALPAVAGWRHYSEGRGSEVSARKSEARGTSRERMRAEKEGASAGRVSSLERVRAAEDSRSYVSAPTSASALERTGPRVESPERMSPLAWLQSLVAKHLRWLVLAWVAGVGLCSGRMTAEWVKLRRLAAEARPAPSEWQERLDALAARLGLGRAVRLLESASVDVPAAVGWLSPVVLLPVSTLSGLSTRQLEMVLAHELAHIRRHDFAVNLAQVLVETLLFYHPAVRWVSHVIRVEREHCCDDVAVSASGGALSYARALTALEELRVLPTVHGPAMSALGGSLPERVRRLITAPAARCSSRWVAGASVLTLASSLAVAAPLTSLVLGSVEKEPASKAAAPVESTEASGDGGSSRMGATSFDAARSRDGATSFDAARSRNGTTSFEDTRSRKGATSFEDARPRNGATTSEAVRPRLSAAPLSGPPAPPVARGAPPAPPAGIAPLAAKDVLLAPSVIAPVPGVVAAAPAPAPAPAPKPGRHDDDDDLDERTRVGAGQQLTVDQLVELKVAGVTPARVQELQSMGYEPTVANLVAMGHAGITPEYAKDMSARFGRKLDADDLVQMKHLGVTPEYIEALKATGFTTNDPDDLVQARAVGVNEAYVRELKNAGYTGMSLEDVSQLRAVGVDAGYIQALSQRGLPKMAADDLMQLRAVGVTPEWLDRIREAGVQTKDAEELTQLRAVGVDPDFLRELRDAGMKDLSTDELIRLRTGGVDADFIRKMRGSKSK
ncbi:M56 family metallopeptidase [Pyxidicoccus parkwayensis]|uniref:M56 family metallopeptidase n=1 Tax=Pyxidicoccus parkwayensis TaxID=2813578 RepID=A0ABX7NR98_9BACT|nr:M56 family metallopeptidase [Pyxidicoccus parkwaysis]QSQ21228.1 M56 family metallopeptidase [Pyxidicoccus parkwaysis]